MRVEENPIFLEGQMCDVETSEMDSSGIGQIENFKTIDDVQKLIKKLQKVEEKMIQTGNGCSKTSTSDSTCIVSNETQYVVSMDDLSLVDFSELDDADETEWLTENGTTSMEIDVAIESIMDSKLMNVRYSLRNNVKLLINEERERQLALRFSNAKVASESVQVKEKMQLRHPRPTILPNSSESSDNVPLPLCEKSSELIYSVHDSESSESTRLSEQDIQNFRQLNNSNPALYQTTSGKYVDTRTFTRPKKNRMSLDGSRECHSRSSSMNEECQDILGARATRSDLTISPVSINMNEHFNPHHEPHTHPVAVSGHGARKVTRNLSYIIRRDSESPNNNSQTLSAQRGDLNTTFRCAPEEEYLSSPSDSNNSLHNISMEELHNMARLQEQSLRISGTPKTLTRKETHAVLELPNIDERPRPPARTSSTDTYCVVQSNPDSPGSSGLSSPMDSQSYDDIQAADAVRRSMPNLAVIKSANGLRGPMLQLAPPMNSLKYQAHHISDSKLSNPLPRTGCGERIMIAPSAVPAYERYRSADSTRGCLNYPNIPTSYVKGQNNYKSGSVITNASAQQRLTHNSGSGLKSYGAEGSIGNSQSLNQNPRSGLPPPRYSSIPARDGGRPSIPVSARTSTSMLQHTGNNVSYQQQSMIQPPQATSRIQSRIPAPGAMRNRQRPVVSAKELNSGKKVTDWRDGCY